MKQRIDGHISKRMLARQQEARHQRKILDHLDAMRRTREAAIREVAEYEQQRLLAPPPPPPKRSLLQRILGTTILMGER